MKKNRLQQHTFNPVFFKQSSDCSNMLGLPMMAPVVCNYALQVSGSCSQSIVGMDPQSQPSPPRFYKSAHKQSRAFWPPVVVAGGNSLGLKVDSLPSCSPDNTQTAQQRFCFGRQRRCRTREERKTVAAPVRIRSQNTLHLPEFWKLKDGVWNYREEKQS